VARILVIDEDALLRANLHRLLALEGHVVVEAQGGLDGVERAYEHPPDLVLCDLVMPDLDGLAVMRLLRADPRTSRVPIVVVTGSVLPPAGVARPPIAADGYVTKPFDIAQLLAVVSEVLARRAPR